MQTTTEQGLETSKAYLKDCVELSHLMLKRQLETLRNGGDVEWKEVREVVKEGRTAARQLTQIASVELRDRQQASREKVQRKPAPRPALKLKVQPTKEMIVRFIDGIMVWQRECIEADKETPMPENLRQVITEFGLDPDDSDQALALLNHLENQHPPSDAA